MRFLEFIAFIIKFPSKSFTLGLKLNIIPLFELDLWFRNKFSWGLSSGGWSPSDIGEQYPGVYMTLINEELVGEVIRLLDIDSVTLVFCISLLNREDFHYNSTDYSGHFNKKFTSFSKIHLQDNIKKKCINKYN